MHKSWSVRGKIKILPIQLSSLAFVTCLSNARTFCGWELSPGAIFPRCQKQTSFFFCRSLNFSPPFVFLEKRKKIGNGKVFGTFPDIYVFQKSSYIPPPSAPSWPLTSQDANSNSSFTVVLGKPKGPEILLKIKVVLMNTSSNTQVIVRQSG